MEKSANDQSNSGPTESIKPVCGNCKFAVMVTKDITKIECRWGPPTASMVPSPGKIPGTVNLQQVIAFPVIPRTWHCHRHERKLDS